MIMMMILVNFISFKILSIFAYCRHSLISHVYIIYYTFWAEMIYDRELDKSLFYSEKPKGTDPTANYFDAFV